MSIYFKIFQTLKIYFLDHKRIWNPIDFQGQRSRSQGLIFRRWGYATLCVALVSSYLLKLTKKHQLPRRMLCGKKLTLWPLTLKINRVPDSPKDYVCTMFGQIPLKDVDSRVFTRMLCGKKLTPWPLTLKINRVPDSSKDYVCTMFGQNPLKDVDSRVFLESTSFNGFWLNVVHT
jgi:hypothetical protein